MGMHANRPVIIFTHQLIALVQLIHWEMKLSYFHKRTIMMLIYIYAVTHNDVKILYSTAHNEGKAFLTKAKAASH